jgi:uncharacterized protein YcfJ
VPTSPARRLPRFRRFLPALLLAALSAGAFVQAIAQDGGGAFAQPENVREEFAQVMRVEPVFETLRATSMVERCEASTPVQAQEPRTGFSRVIGAVRSALTPDPKVEEVAPSAGGECRMVPVDREFRRPVAYDVDYVHRGVKYRTRLPYDPGNRLRVRVSVTPVVSPGP